jgi:hypothetical protein
MHPTYTEPVKAAAQAANPAMLVRFDSCQHLERELKSHFKDQLKNQLTQQQDYAFPMNIKGGFAENTSASFASSYSPTAAAAPQPGVDFSETNNQEAGVDEADIFKNDGRFLYSLNGNSLEIVATSIPGALNYTSRVDFSDTPQEMLLFEVAIPGKRASLAVVFTTNYSSDLFPCDLSANQIEVLKKQYNPTRSKLVVVDLGADRSNPHIIKELYLDGTYMKARKIGSKLFMVSHFESNLHGPIRRVNLQSDFGSDISPELKALQDHTVTHAIDFNNKLIDSIELSDLLPRFYEKEGNCLVPRNITSTDCNNVARPSDSSSLGLSTVLTMDMSDPKMPFSSHNVLSNNPTVYASKNALVLADSAHNFWWWGNRTQVDDSNLHMFNISDEGQISYAASGRIKGHVTDQFSLSEYNGNIRVVTTESLQPPVAVPLDAPQTLPPPPTSTNHLFILRPDNDSDLEIIGRLENMALGESVYSSRLLGDIGYIVTFLRVDPLFTVDLKDPTNPQLIGQLKTPGVATYLHPIDGGHLLTVGYDGNDNGLNWNTMVTLIDVSNLKQPFELSRLALTPIAGNGDGWTYSNSSATNEHRAFTYWPAKHMLAIPLSTYRNVFENGNYSYEYVSKLDLIRVELDQPLSLYAEISHSDAFGSTSQSFYDPEVLRSSFFGDFVYAFSHAGITSTDVDHPDELFAKVRLRGPG